MPQRLPVRAARGYIRGKRYDKAGRVVNARLHPVSGLAGAISGKEMEKMMTDVADTHGLSANDIVIETYAQGTAPRESNPSVNDKYERYTRTVAPPGYADKYALAFGKKTDIEQMRERRMISPSEECKGCKGDCACGRKRDSA